MKIKRHLVFSSQELTTQVIIVKLPSPLMELISQCCALFPPVLSCLSSGALWNVCGWFAPYFTKLYFLDLISTVFKTQKLPFHFDSNKIKMLVKTITFPKILVEQTHIYAHMGMHTYPMREKEREETKRKKNFVFSFLLIENIRPNFN